MTWRITAIALGLVAYLAILAGAIAGSPALAGILITVTVLVVLVAGGNWLQHWLGIKRAAPQFARREPADGSASPSDEAAR